MPNDIGPGSLKLIVSTKTDATERVLREHVRDADLRPLGDGAWIAYTNAEPSEIRDWIATALGDGARVLVVEFERWSAFGEGIDRTWLLRRGH